MFDDGVKQTPAKVLLRPKNYWEFTFLNAFDVLNIFVAKSTRSCAQIVTESCVLIGSLMKLLYTTRKCPKCVLQTD